MNEKYLMISDDGRMTAIDELPEDALSLVDDGVADFIRFNIDYRWFERLLVGESNTELWREI